MYWFVYLIRCEYRSLYCGITTNVIKRWHQHKSGKGAKYLRGRKLCAMVYIDGPYTKGEALKEEMRIKNLTKEEKEKLVILAEMN